MKMIPGVYLMKVIPGMYLMKVILGVYLMKVIPGVYLMKVIPGVYLMKVIPGVYLMKVIPETRRTHQFRYLRFYHYHWVDTSASELLVTEGIIRPVTSASAMTLFIIYTYY
jgi:hypothetical protein